MQRYTKNETGEGCAAAPFARLTRLIDHGKITGFLPLSYFLRKRCLCSASLAYCVIRLADRPMLPHTVILSRGGGLWFLFIGKPPWRIFRSEKDGRVCF